MVRQPVDEVEAPRGPVPLAEISNGHSRDADGDGRALVGGGQRLPEHAEEVLDVEGSAAKTAAENGAPAAVAAWVFRPDEAPCQLALADLREAVDVDANLAW